MNTEIFEDQNWGIDTFYEEKTKYVSNTGVPIEKAQYQRTWRMKTLHVDPTFREKAGEEEERDLVTPLTVHSVQYI